MTSAELYKVEFLEMVVEVDVLVLEGLFEVLFNQEGNVIVLDFGGGGGDSLLFESVLDEFEFLVEFSFGPVHVIDEEHDFNLYFSEGLLFSQSFIVQVTFLSDAIDSLLPECQHVHFLLTHLNSFLDAFVLV